MSAHSSSSVSRPRVVLLRGHSANLWDLRPWGLLTDRYDITAVVSDSNEFDTDGLPVPTQRLASRRAHTGPGRFGRAVAYAVGDAYRGLEHALRGADIVHSAELHTWFSAQAASLRESLGFHLALTVWETIPMLGAYRWPRERAYRSRVLGAADLHLAASERAAHGLLLEGVDAGRVRVVYPGIDVERFTAPASLSSPRVHRILSPGRLVWEKGHQDVLRAVAALQRGLLGPAPPVELTIVGAGPEEKRLRRHAQELGVEDVVDFRAHVAYDEMPALYHDASAMVLGSLPRRGWEEQFGMVLAEGLASGTSIVAARSGAIPEVIGDEASLVDPGDWYGIAQALLGGALARPPGERIAHAPELVERYSTRAAADRLDEAYRSLSPASAAARPGASTTVAGH